MDEYELIFEKVECQGFVKRIGRSKATGVIVFECKLDEAGREIEKCFFDDNGELKKRAIYEYDEERKRKRTQVFDANGVLKFRHERGKRPEIIG